MLILQPRRVHDNEFNRCRCGRRSRRGARLVNREIALISAAFAALGLLVGNLTGLSASPIAKALIPALFTLIGGSFVAFISKVQPKDRSVAASAILSFSVACLMGTYIGIALNAHELLGPRSGDFEHLFARCSCRPSRLNRSAQTQRSTEYRAGLRGASKTT